jgi:transposase
MARDGQAFEDRAVARLLPPESADAKVVAQAAGVSTATLERWRAEALASGKRHGGWTAAARFDAVLTCAAMSEEQKNAWCRAQASIRASWTSGGKRPRARWRTPRRRPLTARRSKSAVACANWSVSCGVKTEALAETAALRVLSKKLEAIFHKDADE